MDSSSKLWLLHSHGLSHSVTRLTQKKAWWTCWMSNIGASSFLRQWWCSERNVQTPESLEDKPSPTQPITYQWLQIWVCKYFHTANFLPSISSCYFFYLFEREIERETRKRKGSHMLIHSARAYWGWGPELGIKSVSPMWKVRTHHLSCHHYLLGSACFRSCSQEPVTEPKYSSTR